MRTMPDLVHGTAAEVPYVLRPPASGSASAPLVIVWHLGDPPRSAAAMAAAIPLAGVVEAWRLYLTLPLAGDRSPPGGMAEVMRRAAEDAVLQLFSPIQAQAVRELPAVLDEVRRDHALTAGRIALVGGSMGGAVAQAVLAELDLPVVAASLLVPAVQMQVLVEGLSAMFGMTYAWTDERLAAARRFDFVARAGELASRRVPIQLVLGADDAPHINGPAEALRDALRARGADLDWRVIPGLAHALADEPGVEPAPQTASARAVDAEASRFLNAHLF